MTFSLKAYCEELEKYPESAVIDQIVALYDDKKKLFNNEFILMTDLVMLGYAGFKTLLYSLYETREEFLEAVLPELRQLLSNLKGDVHNG